MDKFPKLRALEMVPVIAASGEEMVALQDPLRLCEQSVIVSKATLLVLQLLDGEHDIRDIQTHIIRQTGELIHSEQIEALVHSLDETYLLQSERFEQGLAELREKYAGQPDREAFGAGRSYPDEPDRLDQYLGEIFEAHADDDYARLVDCSQIRGLFAPHIDFDRGKKVYARTYAHLRGMKGPVTFVILGTAHAGVDGLISATRKCFETPLGQLKADQELLDRLEKESPFGLGDHDLQHRTEHSIEFQVVMLRHVLDDDEDVLIVPILVGSLDEFVKTGTVPTADDSVAAFTAALGTAVRQSKRRVVWVGGVDLSHMGPRFGHRFRMDATSLEALERDDRVTLDHVLRVDTEGFFHDIAKTQDSRNICGFPPMYIMMTAMGEGQGHLVDYGQTVDMTGSAVSFAGVVIT